MKEEGPRNDTHESKVDNEANKQDEARSSSTDLREEIER